MALAGGPDLALAIRLVLGDAGVRLDVGLMDRRGLEFLLDHHVRGLEPRLHIAHRELKPLGNVRGFRRSRFDASGNHVLEQQRSVVGHGVVDVDDMRQHLIIDLDERRGMVGDAAADGGDGGDGVALVQRLLASQDVAGDVPEIHRDTLGADVVELLRRQIGGGHDGLDAGQRLGGRSVDRLMRAWACGERSTLP